MRVLQWVGRDGRWRATRSSMSEGGRGGRSHVSRCRLSGDAGFELGEPRGMEQRQGHTTGQALHTGTQASPEAGPACRNEESDGGGQGGDGEDRSRRRRGASAAGGSGTTRRECGRPFGDQGGGAGRQVTVGQYGLGYEAAEHGGGKQHHQTHAPRPRHISIVRVEPPIGLSPRNVDGGPSRFGGQALRVKPPGPSARPVPRQGPCSRGTGAESRRDRWSSGSSRRWRRPAPPPSPQCRRGRRPGRRGGSTPVG
jgi:hypothetical protein